MSWYLEALKKYAVFSGRARRKEYWFFALFNTIISFVLAIIDASVGSFSAEMEIGFLGGIYALAILLPSIAVTVRRLHDTDRSGWWFFIVFVPLVGVIVLLVFMLLDSHAGENRFGSNPKDAIA
tara:strand:+ start:142 stop:513 length:372 start_codon:yes stop_codon:yes gene_type:complete